MTIVKTRQLPGFHLGYPGCPPFTICGARSRCALPLPPPCGARAATLLSSRATSPTWSARSSRRGPSRERRQGCTPTAHRGARRGTSCSTSSTRARRQHPRRRAQQRHREVGAAQRSGADVPPDPDRHADGERNMTCSRTGSSAKAKKSSLVVGSFDEHMAQLYRLILPRFRGHPARGHNASRSVHGEAAAQELYG